MDPSSLRGELVRLFILHVNSRSSILTCTYSKTQIHVVECIIQTKNLISMDIHDISITRYSIFELCTVKVKVYMKKNSI